MVSLRTQSYAVSVSLKIVSLLEKLRSQPKSRHEYTIWTMEWVNRRPGFDPSPSIGFDLIIKSAIDEVE